MLLTYSGCGILEVWGWMYGVVSGGGWWVGLVVQAGFLGGYVLISLLTSRQGWLSQDSADSAGSDV